MAQMTLTPLSEIVNEVWGEIGTPQRDEMEAQLKEELHAYYVDEATKKVRQAQHPTQEQIIEKVGMLRAQVCRLEAIPAIVTHT